MRLRFHLPAGRFLVLEVCGELDLPGAISWIGRPNPGSATALVPKNGLIAVALARLKTLKNCAMRSK